MIASLRYGVARKFNHIRSTRDFALNNLSHVTVLNTEADVSYTFDLRNVGLASVIAASGAAHAD